MGHRAESPEVDPRSPADARTALGRTPRLEHGCFHGGTADLPIYVDLITPAHADATAPAMILLHGAFHTGACYLTTPDGRPGWARYFAARGYRVHVVDWPGHGRSPTFEGFAAMTGKAMAASLLALLRQVGPAVLVAHSAAGPFAWWLAEQAPDAVLAVVGVSPGPPPGMPVVPPASAAGTDPGPGYDGRPGGIGRAGIDRPVYVARAFAEYFWANAPQFPAPAIDAYVRGLVPESAALLNERFGHAPSGLELRHPGHRPGPPILVVTGPHDPRHPRWLDEATASHLGGTFVWLPEVGLAGNGHMPMIERNSDAVAQHIAGWLDQHRRFAPAVPPAQSNASESS